MIVWLSIPRPQVFGNCLCHLRQIDHLIVLCEQTMSALLFDMRPHCNVADIVFFLTDEVNIFFDSAIDKFGGSAFSRRRNVVLILETLNRIGKVLYEFFDQSLLFLCCRLMLP